MTGRRLELGRKLPPWVGGVSGWGLSRPRLEEPHRGENEGPSGSKQVEIDRGDAPYSSTSSLTFNLGPCRQQRGS